jgi:aspartate-semialdehyde dehydrogenase
MAAGVPLVIPEVNPDHLDLLGHRASRRGGILTNPNCSTIGLVLALAPIVRSHGVKRVHVVTMQALSGAGIPGVSGMNVIDNVLPFIRGEEEKLEVEARKILGQLDGERLVEADLLVSAQCNRVPVIDGHMECVSVELERPALAEELVLAWNEFRAEPQERGLPSAPAHPTIYLEDEDAPQPRLHRDLERGMATVIGRLQPCRALDWRFVALSHNTLRGAAGGAILLAELAVARGLLPD